MNTLTRVNSIDYVSPDLFKLVYIQIHCQQSIAHSHPPASSLVNMLIPSDIPLLFEIWLQIFTYLPHLDIKSVSLTCQLLCHMAQPQLLSCSLIFVLKP